MWWWLCHYWCRWLILIKWWFRHGKAPSKPCYSFDMLINMTIIIIDISKVIVRFAVIITTTTTIIISARSSPILFTTGDHISQACRIIFPWQTNIFRSISSDHISLYVGGDRVYFSRKFINIVVSLMVRLKRRKWILAIYKVLFKQPVIHSSSNIYQPPLWIKWRRWWNKSTSKTEI